MPRPTEQSPEDAMARFPVNPHRLDPYKTFKFRVKWDGRHVAGVSKVGPLKRATGAIGVREGGSPSSSRKSPGRTECEPITLQRGVTHDVEFERWASLAFTRDGAMSLKNFRKDLVIGLLNEQGTVVPAYRV
jgi:phage tail-like protein